MIKKCPTHGAFRGMECRCGDAGVLLLNDEQTERLGRFISGALRHFPDDLGLAMNQHGWVDLDVLCDAMKTRYKWANKEKLLSIVESDAKGRYEIQGRKIRARYGHSVDVELDFPENTLPELYYGASREEVDILLEKGIKPMKQRYVHLSTSPEKALEVAKIHTDDPILIVIKAEEAQKDGVRMISATETIVLSEEIAPQYLGLIQG
ncbi:MAG: RNA 2'-phosphotransferase [Candidatus Methanoperedens sp.]|nr:RNA 2'-phosphotransferase [Candidatus Methanoperedens sp.]MCZ7359810.1 RNA 2'-phosphotransferase [Candidatus Methanoperedens sp.]HLB69657.1 RNA 2'-phosphotransferase [Candidatus Methanoperedens sp.]